MRLIVNADDFGISKAINLGIIEARREGIVRSTTLMCNMEAVGIAEKAKSEDIKKELECQLNKFLSYGIKPTHIDTHHHVHRIEKVFKVIKEIAIKNNLPVRLI